MEEPIINNIPTTSAMYQLVDGFTNVNESANTWINAVVASRKKQRMSRLKKKVLEQFKINGFRIEEYAYFRFDDKGYFVDILLPEINLGFIFESVYPDMFRTLQNRTKIDAFAKVGINIYCIIKERNETATFENIEKIVDAAFEKEMARQAEILMARH